MDRHGNANKIGLGFGEGNSIVQPTFILRPVIDVTHARIIGGDSLIRCTVKVVKKIREIGTAITDVHAWVGQIRWIELSSINVTLLNHIARRLRHQLHETPST